MKLEDIKELAPNEETSEKHTSIVTEFGRMDEDYDDDDNPLPQEIKNIFKDTNHDHIIHITCPTKIVTYYICYMYCYYWDSKKYNKEQHLQLFLCGSCTL